MHTGTWCTDASLKIACNIWRTVQQFMCDE